VIVEITESERNLFTGIISRIVNLSASFDEFKIYHIKRHLNSLANQRAKEGVGMDKGVILINAVRGAQFIP
jgi:hypothetical protein